MGLIAEVEKKSKGEKKGILSLIVKTSDVPLTEKVFHSSDNNYSFNEIEETNKKIKESFKYKEKSRVSTGIEGLDEVMEGGLRKGTVNLVGGGAGCGKSILSMQYLIEGVKQFNEHGIYISFEENPEKIIQDFATFDWEIQKYVDEKKLVILYYTPEQVNRFLDSGGGLVRDMVETLGIKRMVVDSLTAFSLLFPSELEKTKGILKLFDSIHNWGVTSLMTSEQEPNPHLHKSTIVEFQVDGVILLYNVRKGDIRERSLEVFKMRATRHSAKIFPMQITDNGVTIYPEEQVF